MSEKGKRIYAVTLFVMGVFVMTACQSEKQRTDDEAAKLLSEARVLLANKQYSEARQAVLRLRKDYPTAMDARRAAILTLDSIELLEARYDIAAYEPQLDAARVRLAELEDNPRGHADSAYISQRIEVYKMEKHFDELCAKAKFFNRKIEVDSEEKE